MTSLQRVGKESEEMDSGLVEVFAQTGYRWTMLQRNQKLIDQFNRDEQLWRRLQWRKLKRRGRFPKLGAAPRAILDMLDEMDEKQRLADCVSSEWTSGDKGCP